LPTRINKEAATIIFLTLNTTRAHIDLLERLAKDSLDGQFKRRSMLSSTRTNDLVIHKAQKYPGLTRQAHKRHK
jgi:hypothetical protein